MEKTEVPRLRLVQREERTWSDDVHEGADEKPGWGLIVYACGCLAFFLGVCLMVAFPELAAALCDLALRVLP